MQKQSIAVCGAGTMGSGIAQLIAQNKFTTILFDVNNNMLTKSKNVIESNIKHAVLKQKISENEAKDIVNSIIYTSNINDCKADIIIEAIVEELTAKQNLFEQLAAINHQNTLLVSNTSSISIASIAASIPFPERIMGLHFFNPAPLMKLVEIIETPFTHKKFTEQLIQFTQQLNKVAVVCKDAPGFIVNRVARNYYLEAMRLVENNMATIETVDATMESLGFKMGPFKLMDLIGLDINLNVTKIVYEQLGKPSRLQPSNLQQQKVNENKLGKKSGEGFYTY